MLAHHDGKQAAVPHLRGAVSAVFQFIVHFLAFVTAFRRSSCIVFHSLLLRGGSLKSLGLSFRTRWTVLPYFAVEQGFSQVQVAVPSAKLILGHLNFVLSFAGSVPSLRMACPSRHMGMPLPPMVKFIPVHGRASLIGIEVNERDDAMLAAVFMSAGGCSSNWSSSSFTVTFSLAGPFPLSYRAFPWAGGQGWKGCPYQTSRDGYGNHRKYRPPGCRRQGSRKGWHGASSLSGQPPTLYRK